MSDFPKCCTFVHLLYGRLNHPRFFYHRPWTTSLSSIHGQRPWTILLSSKGDLVSYSSHSRSVTFRSLLGWFLIQFALLDMNDPYGRIGDELIFRYPIKDYNYKFLYSKILLFRLFYLYFVMCYTMIFLFLLWFCLVKHLDNII